MFSGSRLSLHLLVRRGRYCQVLQHHQFFAQKKPLVEAGEP